MIQQLENQLIEDLFRDTQNRMMTPSNLGIIKSGKKEDLLKIIEQINLSSFHKLKTREKFDDWFDKQVNIIHQSLINIYRDNLIINANNPYSYSARYLNQYLRLLYCKTWLYRDKGEKYIQILHPVLSNKFFKAFSDIDISKVNQIKNQGVYYQVVGIYRDLIDKDVSEKNKPLLKLQMGKEY